VTPDAIWALYEDVTTWPSWDAEAELITRDGPFQTGTTGTMKFVGQEPMAYRLKKVDPLREFVDETPWVHSLCGSATYSSRSRTDARGSPIRPRSTAPKIRHSRSAR
jgi:hypothetical protein